jgi:hypothetical protein
MALDTVTDYVVEVRRLLQDAVVPYRYSDENMLSALNMGLLEARRLRPDLFLSSGLRNAVPSFSTTTGSTLVPMDPQYRPAIVYYMCGQTQLMDEENTQDQRATVFMNKFVSQLLTIAA